MECTETLDLRNKYLDKNLLQIVPSIAMLKINKIQDKDQI